MLKQSQFSKSNKYVMAAALLVALTALGYRLSSQFFDKREQVKNQISSIGEINSSEAPVNLSPQSNLNPDVLVAKLSKKRSIASDDNPKEEALTEVTRDDAPAPTPQPPNILQPKPTPIGKPQNMGPQDIVVKDFWTWIGTGVNFTTYSQSVPGLSTVNFGRIKSPSLMFHSGFFFDDQFGLDLGYRITPGQAESGSSISVQNGDYEWKTLSAETIFRPSSATEAQKSEWLWRLGLQQHEMPFIVPLTANSIKVSSNSMTALSAGVEYKKLTKKNIRIETLLRYQHPIASSSEVGSSFNLSPQFTFDGSVGAAYQLRSSAFLGVYWCGQYHSYKFDYTNNSNSFSGKQSLFNSNVDLRLGVEF